MTVGLREGPSHKFQQADGLDMKIKLIKKMLAGKLTTGNKQERCGFGDIRVYIMSLEAKETQSPQAR